MAPHCYQFLEFVVEPSLIQRFSSRHTPFAPGAKRSSPRAPRLDWPGGLVLLVSFSLAIAPGCRSTRDTDRELMHNEQRLLEDELYALEAELNERERMLDACHRENTALRRELAGSGGANDAMGHGGNNNRPRPGGNSRNVEPSEPVIEAPALPNSPAPNVNSGDMPSTPGATFPPNGTSSSLRLAPADGELTGYESARPTPAATGTIRRTAYHSPAEAGDPPPAVEDFQSENFQQGDFSNPDQPSAPPPTLYESMNLPRAAVADPAAVERITLNPRLTGGHNVDQRPGDEGIMVVVSPTGSSGAQLNVPGEISVVLVDPTQNARTARWDFSTAESATFFQQSLIGGEAYHLELRWPNQPPANPVQDLYVRMSLGDGRQLETKRRIRIDNRQPPRDRPAARDRQPQQPLVANRDQWRTAPAKNAPPAPSREFTNLQNPDATLPPGPMENFYPADQNLTETPPAEVNIQLEDPTQGGTQIPSPHQLAGARPPLQERLAERRRLMNMRLAGEGSSGRGGAALPDGQSSSVGLSPSNNSPDGQQPGWNWRKWFGAPPREAVPQPGSTVPQPGNTTAQPVVPPPVVPPTNNNANVVPDGFVIVPLQPGRPATAAPDNLPAVPQYAQPFSPSALHSGDQAPAYPGSGGSPPAARTATRPVERPMWKPYR
ncbi:MAG: hypothetical protein SFX18_00080 [Pirellulales bacterium]|nr:hypothetical protein [Pirellulales bacterium]